MPRLRNTPWSQGSWWRETTTICTLPVSSTAEGPMLTLTPVYIGPRTIHSPSESVRTRPVTASGSPRRSIAGMSVLPPSRRVILAPMPAAALLRPPSGSKIAPTPATSPNPLPHPSPQPGHAILGPARADIVGMVEQQPRPLGQRLGARHRLRQRLGAVEQRVAPLPGGVHQPLRGGVCRRGVAVGDADRGPVSIGGIRVPEAAVHRRRPHSPRRLPAAP